MNRGDVGVSAVPIAVERLVTTSDINSTRYVQDKEEHSRNSVGMPATEDAYLTIAIRILGLRMRCTRQEHVLADEARKTERR